MFTEKKHQSKILIETLALFYKIYNIFYYIVKPYNYENLPKIVF